jgi:hypothetical protein
VIPAQTVYETHGILQVGDKNQLVFVSPGSFEPLDSVVLI